MRYAVIPALLFAATLAVSGQVQTRQPVPAFPGQTAAPPPAVPSPPIMVETVADGLDAPWALAFLPDGSCLVTENGGTMRIVKRDGTVGGPIAGVPPVKSIAGLGLHDIVLDSAFTQNRTLYFTYFAPPKGEAPAAWPIQFFYEHVWRPSLAERRTMQIGTERVARARLGVDQLRLEDVEVIAEGVERRIVMARDGTLFVTGADRYRLYDSKVDGVEHEFADDPDIRRNFSGRVIRIHSDGSIPADNPWLNRATVPADTYAHGLRDPEGAALHPVTGELWVTDHGPQGGDEVDIIKPGADYGWPDVSYGVQYDARQPDGRKNVRVGSGRTSRPDIQEPVYYWVPDIAPSGMMFYTGERFPAWKNNLFIGAMAGQQLVRLVLNGNRVVAEEKLLTSLKQRIREVRQAIDGSVYVLAGASLVRLTPKN